MAVSFATRAWCLPPARGLFSSFPVCFFVSTLPLPSDGGDFAFAIGFGNANAGWRGGLLYIAASADFSTPGAMIAQQRGKPRRVYLLPGKPSVCD